MRAVTINPRFLYTINLSKEEQLKGEFFVETLNDIEEKLLQSQEETDLSNLVNNAAFLSQQLIPDKTISDSVESILGLYIKVGCLIFISFFQILCNMFKFSDTNFSIFITRKNYKNYFVRYIVLNDVRVKSKRI